MAAKLVKKLDEKLATRGPDHIGIRLAFAFERWKQEFVLQMKDAGHSWFTPARATLLGVLPREGIGQHELIERLGISKQAVQQLVDGLTAENILERRKNPVDGRARIIVYTRKGMEALDDADRIKKGLQDRMRDRLGTRRFNELVETLVEIAGD